jgi:hypothetical protein
MFIMLQKKVKLKYKKKHIFIYTRINIKSVLQLKYYYFP